MSALVVNSLTVSLINGPFSTEVVLGALNSVERRFAPKVLYFAGDKSLLRRQPRISIVGSRISRPEGLARARKLARMVVERGGVVVSGLAAGIDSAAHRAAIDAGGSTIAVVGSSLDLVYPPENKSLQEAIMREHLCISQFRTGIPIQRQNFPVRNRTMALVSDATVIVEAGVKSGTISQGWEALRLGRPLFIAKALVDDPSLPWPAELIHYGAQVLSSESINDFFACLPGVTVEADVVPDELAV